MTQIKLKIHEYEPGHIRVTTMGVDYDGNATDNEKAMTDQLIDTFKEKVKSLGYNIEQGFPTG